MGDYLKIANKHGPSIHDGQQILRTSAWDDENVDTRNLAIGQPEFDGICANRVCICSIDQLKDEKSVHSNSIRHKCLQS